MKKADSRVVCLSVQTKLFKTNQLKSYIFQCEDLFFQAIKNIVADRNITIYLDRQFPWKNNKSTMDQIRLFVKNAHVIIFDLEPNIESAVTCIKAGASEYLPIKDFSKKISLKEAQNKQEIEKLNNPNQWALISMIEKLSDQYLNKDIQQKIDQIEGNTNQFNLLSKHITRITNLDIKTLKKEPLLIVEDESSVIFVLEHILSPVFDIKIAKTAKEALKIAEKNPYIKLVLLDIFLPDQDGHQIIPDLNKTLKEAKIVMSTGCLDEDIAQKSIQMGAYNYITKPFNLDQLYDCIYGAICETMFDTGSMINIRDLKASQKIVLLKQFQEQTTESPNLAHILSLFPCLINQYIQN